MRGWLTQLSRVRRWHRRVCDARDATDRYDFLYAFFENAFHLRDRLQDTGAVKKPELDRFFEEREEMRLCRDLANSHKHYSLSGKPSQPRPPSEAYEYARGRGNLDDDSSLVILSDGAKHDAFDLAARILRSWEEFIATHV